MDHKILDRFKILHRKYPSICFLKFGNRLVRTDISSCIRVCYKSLQNHRTSWTHVNYSFCRYRVWRAHVGPGRLHVQERRVDGQRRDGRGHVVPDRVLVRVLRMFDDRLFDRAVGDDRRGVPATDPGNDWRRVNVCRPFQHIHRAADVPDVPGAV